MTQWEPSEFKKKTQNWALLACIVVIGLFTDGVLLDSYTSNRKRVFSPGFVALCIIVATLELVILNGMYGEGR